MARDRKRQAFIAGPEASHEHFKQGIETVARLLAPTLGPTGGLVANQKSNDRAPELLSDSATTMRRILSLGDPRLDIGVMLMRNLVWRLTQEVGDGGATTALITHALYNNMLRLTVAGVNPVVVEKGVRKATDFVIQRLNEGARPVCTEDELSGVALSIVGDRSLAAILGEMSYLLGPDAYIDLDRYVAPYLEREYLPGVNLKAQIASFHLYTDIPHKRALLTSPAVALVAAPLATAEDAVHLMETAIEAGHSALLIIAQDFKEAALHVLTRNQQQEERKISVVGTKLKAVGDERQDAIDDLALLTGATVLGQPFTKSTGKATASDLGDARRIVAGTKSLQLIPLRSRNAAVQQKAAEVRTRLDRLPQSDEDRVKLTRRLASLTGGMGVLKVGAATKAERDVLADDAERALRVLATAQKTGVVAGGGAALARAAYSLREFYEGDTLSDEEAMGARCLEQALAAPLSQIIRNAGVESPAPIVAHLLEEDVEATFDSNVNRIVNAHEAGILDVLGVLETIVRTATSGALMALSTDTIVYHRNPQQSLEP